ncbi:unnamed protein product [Discosporangium mesarthrocarpum]
MKNKHKSNSSISNSSSNSNSNNNHMDSSSSSSNNNNNNQQKQQQQSNHQQLQHQQQQHQPQAPQRSFQPQPQEPRLQSQSMLMSQRQGLPTPQASPQRVMHQHQHPFPQIAVPSTAPASGAMSSSGGGGFGMGSTTSQGYPQHQLQKQQQQQQLHLMQQAQAQQQQQKRLQEQARHQAQAQQAAAMQRQRQYHQQHLQQGQVQTQAHVSPLLPLQQRKLNSILEGYVPPADYQQIDVAVVMHLNEGIFTQWEELLETLDITSESAPANMMAQLKLKASLKRELARLTKLADAQTKFIQRLKMLQSQKKKQQQQHQQQQHDMGLQLPSESRGVTSVSRPQSSHRAPMTQGIDAPVLANQITASVHTSPSSTSLQRPTGFGQGQTGSMGMIAPRSQQLLSPAPQHQTLQQDQQTPMQQQQQQEAQQQQGGGVRGQARAHGAPQQNFERAAVGQRLMQTREKDRWVVMVDACLRLPPTEGGIFKEYMNMAIRCIKVYNGANQEVLDALQSCLSPHVFNPGGIQPAQQALASAYTQWSQRRFP